MTNYFTNIFSSGAQKINLFQPEINLHLRGEKFPPVAVEIQPSELCSHKCPHCQGINHTTEKTEQRRTYLDLELLDSFWQHPPKGIIISGNTGDPLLHPRICSLLESCLANNIPVALITNGAALAKIPTDLLIKVCRGIRISLDAHDSEAYQVTHGVGAKHWDSVTANVRKLVHRRNELSDSLRCCIGVGYLTSKNNLGSIANIGTLARDLNADYIQLRPLHGHSVDLKEIDAAISDKERVILSSHKYARAFQRSYTRCHGMAFYSVIDAKADVYACCHHVGSDIGLIGNLSLTPWGDILNSASRQNVAEHMPCLSCIPFCRLHTVNEELERIASNHELAPVPSDPHVRAHSMFL